MQTTRGQFHPTRFEDVAVTIDFHCNSACSFCIVQEGMNHFKGIPFERFQALVDENVTNSKYSRVIFTGGEVTLEKNLLQFVHYARDPGTFRFIRLQTNGRKLADLAFARSLVDAGINEFFVSLHGADARVQDAISQRPGSFDEAISGLRNLRALGPRLITNTVINTDNVAALPDIVDVVAEHGVARMEFWNYLPMEDHADVRNLIAPMSEVLPSLRRALDRCRARGIEAVTKYIPHCLLGDHADSLDNSQADVIIVESFWNEFPRFNCLYEAVCEQSGNCLGLHHDYVNKFGWEESRLKPTPRSTPWEENEGILTGKPETWGEADPSLVSSHPAWEALVVGVPEGIGALVRVQLTRNQARYHFRLRRGGALDVVVAARDDAAPARDRSRSFNIFYNAVQGEHAPSEIEALMNTVCDLIKRRDNGELALDARKGLLEVRRRREPSGSTR